MTLRQENQLRQELSDTWSLCQAYAMDAKRYQALRRGQHWSVTNGIGDTLRGEYLDAAIDATLKPPNAELSGPRPLAAEGSRSNDGLCIDGKGD